VRANWLLRGSLSNDPDRKKSQFLKITSSGEAIRKNWEYLEDGYFKNTDLTGIELYDARLRHANFEDALLFMANLSGSDLRSAYLGGADLSCANLARADLDGVQEWQSTRVDMANIRGVRNPPPGFVKWALSRGAVDLDEKEWTVKTLSKCREEFAAYLNNLHEVWFHAASGKGTPGM